MVKLNTDDNNKSQQNTADATMSDCCFSFKLDNVTSSFMKN